MDIAGLLKGKKEETSEDLAILKERVDEIHTESIVIDGHVGSLFDLRYGFRNMAEESGEGHVDVPKLKNAKVSAIFLSVFPDDRIYPVRGVKTALEYIDVFKGLFGNGDFIEIGTAKDIETAHQEGKIGALLSFEDGHLLEGSLEALRAFHRLGLRMLGLAWDDRNLLADGAGVAKSRGGLTPLGLKVLHEAERLGIIIDVSHLSEAGFWDVVEEAEMPFVASHANCYALEKHPRNLTDDQLKAIADKGGVVGISFNPAYLGSSPDSPGEIGQNEETEGHRGEGDDEDGKIRQDQENPIAPKLERVVGHILHAIEVAGEEHVAIGSDFDSFRGPTPEPLTDISKLPFLTRELLRKGLSGKAISGILGGNWLRVARAVLG